jgi:hypothetical protein
MDIKPDMGLSEFIGLTSAISVPQTNDWIVTMILANGAKSNLTVANCYSEFDAKERCFFYLLDRINSNKI